MPCEPRPGQLILDLAAGTGTSSEPFAAAGATVVPTDLSLGMLQVGKQRRPGLSFVAADALQLPYADASFDAVTISFGLRNVEDTATALREMLRVTKPGGAAGHLRVLHSDLARRSGRCTPTIWSRPSPGSRRWSPPTRVAYEYLAESIQAWPDQPTLAEAIAAAGWQSVEWRNLSGGIVALHRARA